MANSTSSHALRGRLGTLFYCVPPSQLLSSSAPPPSADEADAALLFRGLKPYVTEAIPFFFLLVAAEAAAGLLLHNGRRLYRLNDLVHSVSLGIVQQLLGLWTKAVGVTVYVYLWRHHRLLRPSLLFPHDDWRGWLTLLLGCDVAYYWFHRTAHSIHALWAAHAVHHSGEDYNLATALRQGALQACSSWVFYLPLALLGAHPALYASHQSLNTLYQFWIHTSLIGHLGPLEHVLNTASHHRMHHRPPGNCNYAGVLIIWDRMFGTFRPEDRQRECYGLAKQAESFDPLHTNAEHWRRVHANIANGAGARRQQQQQQGGGGGGGGMLDSAARFVAATLRRRVRHPMVFRPAALFEPLKQEGLWTLPPTAEAEAAAASAAAAAAPSAEAAAATAAVVVDRACPPGERRKYDGRHGALGALRGAYVLAHFVGVLGFALGGVLLPFGSLGRADAAARCVGAGLSLSCVGRLADGGALGDAMETARVALVAAGLLLWRPAPVAAVVAPGVLAAALVLAWGAVLAVGRGGEAGAGGKEKKGA
jgi:sterol desaturase/sphingolipid hydroxylase (fatty acid hydroxylase superfamily)